MKKYSIQKEDQVRLRPLFSIPPQRYMPVVLLLVLLIILFSLLVLPGLISSKARITVDPLISDAGIWVDGTYVGSVSSKPLIESGEYDIQVKKPYFKTISFEDLTVRGNVLFSIFTKRDFRLSVDWELTDPDGFITSVLTDLSQWSPIEQYSERYLYPEILTRTADQLRTEGTFLENRADRIEELYTAAAGYITNEVMYEDLTTALGILDEITIDQELIALLKAAFDEKSDERALTSYTSSLSADDTAADLRSDDIVELGESRFLPVPEGFTTILGNRSFTGEENLSTLPYSYSVEHSYYVSRIEVTEREYARFVEENPYWSPENRRNLISDGVADSYYLDGINLYAPTSRPIRNISWYAAEAYAQWFTESMDGYRARLLSSSEWETALRAYKADDEYTQRLLIVESDDDKLFGMMGSLWEFTSSAYVPNPSLGDDSRVYLPSDDMTVRGGSYVNDDAEPFTRGHVTRSLCSPFIGFRLALEEDA